MVDMKMLKFIKRTILPELRGSEMTTAEFDLGEASIIKNFLISIELTAAIPKTFLLFHTLGPQICRLLLKVYLAIRVSTQYLN